MRLARILSIAAIVPLVSCFTCTSDKDVKSQGPQGWSDTQRLSWYTVPQGSRLLPYKWLKELEQPDSAAAFLDPANIAHYRYLPSMPDSDKKTNGCVYDPALPIGFTVECVSDEKYGITKLLWMTGQKPDEPWVGMNCSACHTNEIDYKGKPHLVDGAPTLADFQSFMEALNGALKATKTDDAKFGRFAAKVLGPQPAPGDAEMLRGALAKLVDWNDKLDRLNDDKSTRYGYGRLDAIGHIFNKVALVAMPEDAASQISNPSDAPVSYPFLWNITQLDKVEWDGIVPNKPVQGEGGVFDIGALGRNTGEVIGVFGDITITPKPGIDGYVTSVNEHNLIKIEEQLRELQPPKWPADFPAVDTALASTGKELFKAKCQDCHAAPAEKFNISDKYTVTLSRVFSSNPADDPVQTDIWMACNAVFDRAKTGKFQGTPLTVVATSADAQRLGDNSDNLGMLQVAAVGTIAGQKVTVAEGAFEGLFGIDRGLPAPQAVGKAEIDPKKARRNQCMSAMMEPGNKLAAQIVYKGRPLQGIWATAPYLHNGSVASLAELLLPPAERKTVFYVGAREFDPVNVGFVTEQSEQNSFRFDTSLDGNSNGGHDYDNKGLTPDQRKALVEYMKTL